jgi:hypothetical protein
LKKHLATVNGPTVKRRKPGDRAKESAA